ncbi:hypothetical protein PABG_05761 [Paracoccidioides brasiliensis Pb03]|uniref:ABM domain-containing protein n=1 Tax=Paracoccidioides brasiliensis (strain Pb18) TaxID=502780 RepID=C1GFR5_PARBD|nr:uncharacterized protein PADG_06101 [Paracoccidioides brasiliensis Pb18]EEH23550.1 hypothetical protein PABG_05761 [Paracoccidioides brasiliensis Pb03]EEH50022.2 hypothetical protein PADG_06101 [Paracoccidioides brasiliensis Pb18]ODH46757.1 hypothetical protein GX48_07157 [Paracoccidioides brasiliensis]
MASKEIHLVAIIKPKPGKIDEVAALFAETAKKVQATEPDTLAYYAIRPKTGDELLIVERQGHPPYKDAKAIQTHGSTEHFKEFSEAVAPLVQGPSTLKIGREVGGFRRDEKL